MDQHNPLKDLVEWWNATPDTSVPKIVVPNSTIPQGKTTTQGKKPKLQSTQKVAQVNKGDGVKISGNVQTSAKEEKECKKAPWMDIAEREYNQWKNHHESQKAVKIQHDKRQYSEGIIEDNYHKLSGVNKNWDIGSDPWCASFVSYCLKDGGYNIKPSASSQFPINNPEFARIAKPIYGAMAVFRYKNGTGHIGFIYGKAKIKVGFDYAVLGGNQSDTVTLNSLHYYTNKAKATLMGYYVPKEYADCARKIIAKGDDLEEKGSILIFKDEAGDKTGASGRTR